MELSIHHVKDLYWYNEVAGITLVIEAREARLMVDVFGDEVEVINIPYAENPLVYSGVGVAFHVVTRMRQEDHHVLPSGTGVSNVLIQDRDGEHRITLFWN